MSWRRRFSVRSSAAATHAAAGSAEDTNWYQVHILYKILERIAPNPMVTLNRAIALAEINGPRAGLALLSTLDSDARMAGHHRLPAVRAHLLEKAGELPAAYEHYKLAARTTSSLAERRYLESRAVKLSAYVRPVPAGPAARS